MILLNNVELTNYILDTPYKDTIDDELDNLNFQLKSTTRIDFRKGDKLQYIVKQQNYLYNDVNIIEKTFMVFDWVETYEDEYWLYQLTLLSPTKLLEGLIVNGMAETYGVEDLSVDLKDQAERVVDKINAQFTYEMGSDKTTLVYDNATFLYLVSKLPNDFLWSGQQTTREILQDICDKADCLIIGTDYEFNNGIITSITLGVEKREKKGSLISSGTFEEVKNEIGSVVKGITINRDSEYSNGNIISLIKNGICKDNVQQTYLPARNDDMTIDDSADWHIITQEPIYSLNKVCAMIPVLTELFYWKNENDTWVEKGYRREYHPNYDYLYLPVDITEYIVEKDVYDAMSVKDQKMHLYFKRGEKGIYGLYKLYKNNPLWSTTAMYNIAHKILYEDLNNVLDVRFYTNDNGVVDWDNYGNPKVLKLDNNTPVLLNLTTDGVDIHISTSKNKENGAISRFQNQQSPTTADMKYCLFSVNYQPYCDSVVKIQKSTWNNVKSRTLNLSTLKNQSDRTIDATKYYDSQQALINRLGNEEMELDCMFDLSKQRAYNLTNKKELLYNLGDYLKIDGKDWTCVKREISRYSDKLLKCRLTFSLGFNASNSAINLNRDKRLYGIPLNQYVDRYIICKKPLGYVDYTKLLIVAYDDFTLNQTESTDNSQIGYCVLDLIKIGNSNIIDRVARCKDNYAVDIERTKYSSTIVNINLRYCDKTGYKDDISIKLLDDSDFNNINISDYSRLPFIVDSVNVGSTITFTGIKKDKMERLIFIVK